MSWRGGAASSGSCAATSCILSGVQPWGTGVHVCVHATSLGVLQCSCAHLDVSALAMETFCALATCNCSAQSACVCVPRDFVSKLAGSCVLAGELFASMCLRARALGTGDNRGSFAHGS